MSEILETTELHPLLTCCLTAEPHSNALAAALEAGQAGPIWQTLLKLIKTGVITAASNPEAIIAALAAVGVVVPPAAVPLIVAGCGWLVKIFG